MDFLSPLGSRPAGRQLKSCRCDVLHVEGVFQLFDDLQVLLVYTAFDGIDKALLEIW